MELSAACISRLQSAVESPLIQDRRNASRQSSAFSTSEMLLAKFRSGVVILLGLTLTFVLPRSFFGQITQQQQQEERQREEQAREQQQREQQEREQQAREEQQREQQAREQQQRDEQQREEQERQRQTPPNSANSSTATSPSVDSSVSGPIPAASQVSNGSFATSSKPVAATESHAPSQSSQPGAKRMAPRVQTLEPDGRTNSAVSDGKNTTPKGQNLRLPAPDLRHRPCDKESCAEPDPKPVQADLHAKLCKGRPCVICAPGQSPGKDNSCVLARRAKGAAAARKTTAVPQACPAGQTWNGVQCAPVGAQQCLPGQTLSGTSCQTNCTIVTAGAQNYIELLRMARQDEDQACTRNPTGQECQQAESTYNTRLNEYRMFLAGAPTTCALPDPISI